MRRRLVDPLTSEERPVAEEFPAFTTLALGRDGRIWIREFQRPRDEQRNAWIAFADDGSFACRAVLPDVDQVFEFGQDYILALDRDDLGIERVVRYALTAPAELE